MIQHTVSTTYKIDDLAQLSGIPSRTIRFYNTQGLLPPPLMHGRVAYYNQEHVLTTMPSEQQMQQFEAMFTLTDTLISVLHRGLLQNL